MKYFFLGLILIPSIFTSCDMLVYDKKSILNIRDGTIVKNSDDLIGLATVGLIKNGKVFCSGTLIGRHAVLTAAHCLKNKKGIILNPVNILVTFDNNAYEGKKRIKASKVHVHSNFKYNTNGEDDIGIIELEEDAVKTKAGMIVERNSNIDLKLRDSIIMAGYGSTSDKTQDNEGILRFITGKVVLVENEEFFTVKPEKGGICGGDSGSPAYYKKDNKYFLVGYLVVAADVKGDCESNVGYIDIRKYENMIKKITP